MLTIVGRRLLELVLVLVVASALVFGLLFVVSDPVASYGARSRSPEVRQELRHRYGLDRPLYVQYARWVRRLAAGDLGTSMVHPSEQVGTIVASKTANTARLAAVAFAVELVLGTLVAVVAQISGRGLADRAIALASALTLGMPVVLVCLILQQLFALRWRMLPLSGSPSGGVLGVDAHVVLPAAALVLTDAALVARVLRGALGHAVVGEHVRAARATGVSELRVFRRHVLQVALPEALPYLGLLVGSLFTGAVIVENVFGYDGLGRALVVAILSDDNPVVLGVTVYSVVVFVVVASVVDIVRGWLDPRIRTVR